MGNWNCDSWAVAQTVLHVRGKLQISNKNYHFW